MATPSVTYTFAPHTLIKASEANTNFQDIIDFLTNEVIQKDASTAFTVTPSGPAVDPTTDNQFARKKYVDDKVDAVVDGINFQTEIRGRVLGKRVASSLSSQSSRQVTVPMPGVTSNWFCVAQVMASGSANSLGATVVSHNAGNVIVDVWTRSGNPATASFNIEVIAINGNQLEA